MKIYPTSYGDDSLFPETSNFAVIQKDNHAGKGVITYRSWLPGEVLAKFAGVTVHEIQQHTLQLTPDTHILDMYFVGFLLHSCDPNVQLDMENRTVTAIKTIEANSFLLMDYAQTEDKLFCQFQCSCGSGKCRGWITGKNEIDNIFV